MQFGTWSARTSISHLPKVVLITETLNAIHGHTNFFVPHRLGFIVTCMDRYPNTVSIEAQGLSHEFPTPRNRFGLEVITERKIAHHLKEDEVTLSAADIIKVVVFATGTSAFLNGGCPTVRRNLITNKVGLKRDHPCNGEQDRRIVRNQTGRWDRRVIAFSEKFEEARSQFLSSARRQIHNLQILPLGTCLKERYSPNLSE
ncbi:unannotated protein [freshwater metagenome]|uniref:Unannotated protein n=1 Tax=freshwater metagenome TaxID=449393 RepID=A0A6J6GJ67_9ZZZZ